MAHQCAAAHQLKTAALECSKYHLRPVFSTLSSKHKLRLGTVTLREGGSLNNIKHSGNQLPRIRHSVRNGTDRVEKKINYCMAINRAV